MDTHRNMPPDYLDHYYPLLQRNKHYTDLLHTYNEIKDATQNMLSILAKLEGSTLSEAHSSLDIDPTK
ncbi:Swi5, putative [Angomonas deanei]|uniref:Swi5, putative n=1 Tax=Angomonas deanei TaxID=59799 RepID=A0A7G2C3Z5_9TRYP|nr:Swi5, putative [Angomonas deanei]